MPRQELDRQPATAPAVAMPDDPLLRLQTERQEDSGRIRWLATEHPEEIVITGITVICARCSARRDWMVMCHGSQVSIRCRCSHQWVEPELDRADFDAMTGVGEEIYPSLDDVARARGFDGAFAGTYLL